MSDKEKLLIAIILAILGGVISYRIEFIDDRLEALELKIELGIDQLTHINKGK